MYNKKINEPIFIEFAPPFKIDKSIPQFISNMTNANKVGLDEIVRNYEKLVTIN